MRPVASACDCSVALLIGPVMNQWSNILRPDLRAGQGEPIPKLGIGPVMDEWPNILRLCLRAGRGEPTPKLGLDRG